MELVRLYNVCRLCLKQHSNNIAMFGDESLMQKVAYVFQFPIQQTEPLSNVICPPCYGTVSNFAEYAQSVGRNQAYLAVLLANEKHTDGPGANASPVVSVPGTVINKTPGSDFEEEADREEVHDRDVLPVTTHMPKSERGKIEDNLIGQYVGLHCEVCDKGLSSFQALNEHCRAEHGTGAKVTCCGKRFTRKDRLHTHIINHIRPDAFKCETCGQICKSKATLEAHRKQHLAVGERAYRCGQCEQRFVSRSQLTNHQFTHVPNDQRKHVCSTCKKTFAFKYSLVRHMKLHSRDGKEFVCEICAKSYSTEAGLKQHLANHSGEGDPPPRVMCTVCDQSYKNRETLRLHMRDKHSNKQAQFCDACQKDFPSKSTLAAHIKYVHVRETRYACDECGAEFRRRVELREHASRHTGKALYKCDVCGQTFNHSSNYSIHRKNKHQR